jgi:hypothetical protein
MVAFSGWVVRAPIDRRRRRPVGASHRSGHGWATDGIDVATPAQPSSAPTGCFSKDEVTIGFEAWTLTDPAPRSRPAGAGAARFASIPRHARVAPCETAARPGRAGLRYRQPRRAASVIGLTSTPSPLKPTSATPVTSPGRGRCEGQDRPSTTPDCRPHNLGRATGATTATQRDSSVAIATRR